MRLSCEDTYLLRSSAPWLASFFAYVIAARAVRICSFTRLSCTNKACTNDAFQLTNQLDRPFTYSVAAATGHTRISVAQSITTIVNEPRSANNE